MKEGFWKLDIPNEDSLYGWAYEVSWINDSLSELNMKEKRFAAIKRTVIEQWLAQLGKAKKEADFTIDSTTLSTYTQRAASTSGFMGVARR